MRLAAIVVLSLLAGAAPATAGDARVPAWFVRAGGGPAVGAHDAEIGFHTGSWWTLGAGVRTRPWLSVSANLGWAHLPVDQVPRIIPLFNEPAGGVITVHEPLDVGSLTIESAFTLPVSRVLTPFVAVEAGVQQASSNDGRAGSELAGCAELALGIAILPDSARGRFELSLRGRRVLAANRWAIGGFRVAWAF